MGAYLILLLVVLTMVFLSGRYKEMKPLVFIILALFAGLRYNVGIDYISYVTQFSYLVDGYKDVVREPFFYYIVVALDKIGGTHQFIFLVFAGITQYFMYKAIKENSINFSLSVLLYFSVVSFYLFTFNVVRQWVALPIFLYSIKFLKEKDPKRFFTYNVIAGLCFHVSLILLLPLYFVIDREFSKWKKTIFIGMAVFAGLSIRTIIAYTPYGFYVMNDELAFQSSIDFKIYAFFLFAIGLEFFRSGFGDSRMTRILLNFNFVSILILIVLLFQNSGVLILVIKRMHNYFLATYIFLIPLLFQKIDEKFKNYFLAGTYVVLIFLFLLTIIFTGDNLQVVPYQINFDLFK